MQRGRSLRDDFFGFGDPFAGFGAYDRPGSLMSSFFGGKDPFDDPFFTQPFGAMMGPSSLGHNMFSAGGSFFGVPIHGRFLEDQAPQQKKSRGLIIKELSSDDEGDEKKKDVAEEGDNRRKHSRPDKEPYVRDPDEEIDGDAIDRGDRYIQQRTEYNRANPSKPQDQMYSFHSTSVTYGGHNGAYYTKSTTRRTGGDGVIVEEKREADTTTGKATQRISRGLGNKGHSVTRKLNSDGRVDTVQTLHNLDERELDDFKEAWKGNANKHLPGWNRGLEMPSNGSRGGSGMETGQSSRGWALPAAEQHQEESQAHRRRHFPNRS